MRRGCGCSSSRDPREAASCLARPLQAPLALLEIPGQRALHDADAARDAAAQRRGPAPRRDPGGGARRAWRGPPGPARPSGPRPRPPGRRGARRPRPRGRGWPGGRPAGEPGCGPLRRRARARARPTEVPRRAGGPRPAGGPGRGPVRRRSHERGAAGPLLDHDAAQVGGQHHQAQDVVLVVAEDVLEAVRAVAQEVEQASGA